ncbi:flagellar basal body rod protein FlgF [Thiomicrospira microaerophila]|uniref:flagellar basal body rod protein FlgF n=1 Tax=Thiomicrospira microaerophila TaxID=406020 RepID=UPI00200D3952|nr:flagellar basal body rod protein FlgF [Thiomicrospira microaerophila]UQB42694.1 flagellar basal body rod protein FlgF [Thiomicrospira microaerophila]
MDRMLYVSMSGAKEALLSQANNANNLANATTDGFKQDFNQFRAQHMDGPGWHTRSYSMDERPATDFSAGPIKVTGRALDVATKENGYMAILTPAGDEAYIRSASMQITADGQLVDVHGNPMLNAAGAPIVLPPVDHLEVGIDGTISVVPAGAPANEVVVLDQLRLVEPDHRQLEKGLDGFIRQVPGNAELGQADIRVINGALEGSNVNTVQALVTMIELTRKYEMQVKMMKTSKDHAGASDKILSIR